jgi:hypothetical protein
MFPAACLHRQHQTYIARRMGTSGHAIPLIEAMVALIDLRLASSNELLPGRAANALLDELMELGAERHQIGDTERLTIYGVVATSTAQALGLLRNWQRAANRTLAAKAEAAA